MAQLFNKAGYQSLAFCGDMLVFSLYSLNTLDLKFQHSQLKVNIQVTPKSSLELFDILVFGPFFFFFLFWFCFKVAYALCRNRIFFPSSVPTYQHPNKHLYLQALSCNKMPSLQQYKAGNEFQEWLPTV